MAQAKTIIEAMANLLIESVLEGTTSEISVRASESELGRNQNKWIDVSCLHWSKSMSEIFVLDVRVRARPYM